jgi:hypothetical protein
MTLATSCSFQLHACMNNFKGISFELKLRVFHVCSALLLHHVHLLALSNC